MPSLDRVLVSCVDERDDVITLLSLGLLPRNYFLFGVFKGLRGCLFPYCKKSIDHNLNTLGVV